MSVASRLISHAHGRALIFLVTLVSAGGTGRFRGGKKTLHDSWFGLERREDFADFRRWWHRVGKDAAGGYDLSDRWAAERAYREWVDQGRPKVS